ncbi:MAG: DUF3850 domain-containing protein [Flavobacterium sp.]
MNTHHLKVWPEFFRELVLGIKKVEIRRNDRNFKERDILVLQEWNPNSKKFTGFTVVRKIDHLMSNLPGLEQGYVVLQISKVLQE